MKDITIKTAFKHYQLSELSTDEQCLIHRAIEATDNAYVPYSHFCVGAAAQLANGTIIVGANQENASFPAGICAERAAVFNAQSNQPKQPITALAIAAKNGSGLTAKPVSPCGICRQALLEIERRYKQNIKLYLYGTQGVYVAESINDMLPLAFTDF